MDKRFSKKELYGMISENGLTPGLLTKAYDNFKVSPSDWRVHAPTKPITAENVIHELLIDIGLDLESRVLDLGCGTGFMNFALAAAGFRSYGVDNDPGMASIAKANLDKGRDIIGKDYAHEPLIMQASYMDGFSKRRFSDGASPADMDAFYCYFFQREHIPFVMRSLDYAKQGSILLLGELHIPEAEELGFECRRSNRAHYAFKK